MIKKMNFLALALVLVVVFSTITMADEDSNGDSDSSGEDEAGEISDGNDANEDAEIDSVDEDDETSDGVPPVRRPLIRPNIGERSGERTGTIRERYEERQRKFLETRQKYAEIKEEARVSIGEYAKVKARWLDANAEVRSDIRTELNSKAKVALQNQVEALLKYLESVKEKDVNSEKVDELIAQWEQIKLSLEDENLSGSELLEISKEIRQNWLTHRNRLKKIVGVHTNDKLKGLFDKAETFSEKFSGIIEQLKADGKDTSLLEEGLDKVNEDLNLYTEAYAKLKAAYEEADGRSDYDEIVAKANALLKVMHNQLQKDFKLMKALFKATRELNSSAEISSDTTEEINSASIIEEDEVEEALEGLEDEMNGEEGASE